ncbi:MAG: hypothetical protein GX791_03115 [Synergistaceae bacterium]|nr:hypothetical protein [Synergistaceae bacterium]
MSLAEIKTKIEGDARAEAQVILEKAHAQANAIQAEADGDIRKIERTYHDRFTNEKPEILRRREIVAGLDVKKMELGVKQDAISKSFDGAVELLKALPVEKAAAFTESLLDKAVETGKETLFVMEGEKLITKEWVDDYNKRKKTSLLLGDEPRQIAGGFILAEGDIETNCSWDMLVRWVREDIEAGVVQRLFSD